jgi:hypothetical protein
VSAENHTAQQQQFTLRLLRLSIAILQARSAALDLGEPAIAEAIAGAHELVKAKLETLEPYRRTLGDAEGEAKKFERIPAFELTPDEADKVSGSVGAALAIEARKGGAGL